MARSTRPTPLYARALRACHSERSEESFDETQDRSLRETLRFTQGDTFAVSISCGLF
jgi:hypothetical protein